MNYYIGIDGGASKTKCICVDENNKIISSAEGEGSNPLVFGFERSANLIISLIQRVREDLQISYIVMGIAGCGRTNHADRLKNYIHNISVNENLTLPNFQIVSDVEIMHEGAFNGNYGIVLISGTGSILIGKTRNGNKFYIGGFGRIIGDGGSGYSIGRKGLDAAAKAMDKRIKHSILLNVLTTKFQIDNRDKLINDVYSNNFNVASFAPFVIKAAEKNDETAKRIINSEIDELFLHIEAAKKYFKHDKIPLCLAGSILLTKNYLSKLFIQKLKTKQKEIIIKKAKYPAEIGAAILAKKLHKELNLTE